MGVQTPPLFPMVCRFHMAVACADIGGLRLVPPLTASLVRDNVSWKSKLQIICLGAQQKLHNVMHREVEVQ